MWDIANMMMPRRMAPRRRGRAQRPVKGSGLGRLLIPVYRAAGAGLAIGIMEMLAGMAQEPVSRVPFVTSIVLVMALPDSLPAQPRALIGGHMLSCAAGWLCAMALGPGDVASAAAVGLATLGMMVAGVLHPPAGLDAFLIATQNLPPRWMVSPVLIGTVLLAVYSRLWAEGERRVIRSLAERRMAPSPDLTRGDKEKPLAER
jgi:CBS-domain-containing membrane protein